MQCRLCQREVEIGDKVYFRDECPNCRGDLHICLNCEFYDRYAAKECREPSAELVSNKERANYCDYFRPGGNKKAANNSADDAKKRLDALFKKS
jgi:hypothetical protein